MIKKAVAIILLTFFLFLFSVTFVFARRGCCSHHGGVSCSAGPQPNGRVVCNDGSRNSSCYYSEMIMCAGNSNSSENSRKSLPVRKQKNYPTNTPAPIPTNTPASTPTKKPTVIKTPSVVITSINTLIPTVKPKVKGAETSNSSSSKENLISLGVLSGLAFLGYKGMKKILGK